MQCGRRFLRIARGLWLGLLASAGCAHNLQLVVPDTTPGASYSCPGRVACEPASVDDPAAAAQSGTSFVVLARQCNGRIHRILVSDAGSSSPQVTVTCAPVENDPTAELR